MLRIEPGLLRNVQESDFAFPFLVADSNLYEIRALFPSLPRFLVAPGESSKNLENAAAIWKAMLQSHCDRKTTLLAYGGGVTTDLAGFAASCYMRGVNWIAIPTTLLGMIDAAIGGKTGVNFAGGKNLIGSFHPPKEIWIDTECLETLPERQYRSGLAEGIKIAAVRDSSFFAWLEDHIEAILERDTDTLLEMIRKCVELKLEVTDQDLKEHGLRALLNFGHTIGHAIEAAAGYETYEHGEAVAIGMRKEAEISRHLGLLGQEEETRLHSLLERAGFDTQMPSLSEEDLIHWMKRDKKSASQSIAMILLESIGKGRLTHLQEKQARELLTLPHAKASPQSV